MIFALAGNQNCGKTTLFNQLTGSNQHVGNFPGVTVDQKTGDVRGQKDCQVVDLPGIYSIRPYTPEEIVTRDFILNQKPDGIINIVDATNIERNLYLTLQLMEMHIPMVLALNMMDEVSANGGTIDVRGMSKALGIPVVPISAVKNQGVEELIRTAVATAKNRVYPTVYDFCSPGPVHRCIHAVVHQIEDHAEKAGLPVRFAATKLIEDDEDIRSRLELDQNELELIEHSVQEMEAEHGMDRNAALADMRYDFIEGVCRTTVVKCRQSRERARSEAIDRLVTHKYLALPIFFGIMLLIFYLTFNVIGAFLSDLLAAGIDALTATVDAALTAYGLNPVVHSLVIDGVFAGVGSVLSFLPIIVVLFFFLSILEDTGYMARVAFFMDQLLRKIGLSGRSIVPMLIGFGCSVPAIMSARTLASERDRRMTILLTPFMSCSAKIPIYGVFSAAFFPDHAALVMIGLYLGGILVGILAAKILGATAFRGNPVPFVMELPNYRFPSAKSVWQLCWDKAKDFLTRAFTIIFVATIIVWFLQTFDTRLNLVDDSSQSLLATVGAWIAPLFVPLGFGDWRVSTALITGFIAKESVISTLGILTGSGTAVTAAALGTLFTPVSAASFLTFTLLYTPCVAAISAVKRELNSGWRAAGVALSQCVIAWVAALVVYRLLLLLG
nr:ferrous iron transport protein B [uncultured Dysosmobacter sp.]